MSGNAGRVCGLAFAALVVLAAAEPRPVFTVGALRRDGILIPFATYNGKRWETNWPTPKLDLVVPITIGSVPSAWWGPAAAPNRWDAWVGQPAPQTVSVTQLDWVDVHCQRQVGLRTTYRSEKPAPPPTIQPYPKDGVAISPAQRVEAIDLLSTSDPEVQALAGDLRLAFNKAERQVAEHYGHPVRPQRREGIAPDVEAAYAFGREPRVYYLEATRSYRRLGEDTRECLAVAYGTGWFAREEGRIRPLGTAIDLLQCDRYGASYMFPFGVLRLDGKIYWLAQFSGWDRERFVVIELMPKHVEARVDVFGGGCS